MASASGHINIDDFDADASASGQRTAEVTKGLGESVENRASQKRAANSALYSSSFSSQGNLIPQGPSNNPVVGHASSLWGYDPTFGYYSLDPALSQPSYHQPPYKLASQINDTPFRPSPEPRFSSPPWESASPSPAPSATPAPHTSITPEVRDGNKAGTKRGGRTRIRGVSQRGRGRGATSRASS